MKPARLMIRMSAAMALCGLAAGCGAAADTNDDTLKLGAYSVMKEAFHDGILPAFASEWKRRTGRDVRFEESYSASGAQARSIASGLDADVAVLSHSGDMRRLVEAGRVKPDWDAGPHKGIISHSLVVIGYRPGNPKGIKDWDDLARPGVSVLQRGGREVVAAPSNPRESSPRSNVSFPPRFLGPAFRAARGRDVSDLKIPGPGAVIYATRS